MTDIGIGCMVSNKEGIGGTVPILKMYNIGARFFYYSFLFEFELNGKNK